MLEQLCPPALIYVCFALTQIIIDMFKGLYNTSFFKFWVMIIFTMLLNILCNQGLGVISWLMVFVPFISMTTVTAILLVSFGLDPRTGAINVGNGSSQGRKERRRRRRRRHDDPYDSDSDSDSSGSESDSSGRSHHRNRKAKCKKMGCTLWDGEPDGNCIDRVDPKTGKCHKQCFFGCNMGTGTCNYDLDCKPSCPVKEKLPCDTKNKKPSHGTSTEEFTTNMIKTTRLG